MVDSTNTKRALPDHLIPEMVFVEGGRFMMGDDRYVEFQPLHEVEVPSFYLARYPVTNEQFVAFLNEIGNQEERGQTWVNLAGNFWGVRCGIQHVSEGFAYMVCLGRHPMLYVNWFGASAYCSWLNAKTEYNYRLPSEAEWEYAARGGNLSHGFRYAGSNKLKEVGYHLTSSHRESKPVGQKLPNELGLYDMSGNVREWCADYWHDDYEGAPKDGSVWIKGGEKDFRVVRGGAWNANDFICTVSYRGRDYAHIPNSIVGFRLARY